jgi:hypothetical protein
MSDGKSHMPQARSIILFLLFLGMTSTVLRAEDLTRPVRVITSAGPAEGETSSSIEKVILDSMSLELRLRGYYVPSPDADTKADFQVVAEYNLDGNDINVVIRCTEAGREKPVGSGRWLGTLTLNMDEAIQDVIRNEILPYLPENLPSDRREVEKAAKNGEEWALAIIAAEEQTGSEPAAQAPANRWRAGIVGSAFFPMADTADYAKTGFGGTLALNYVFRLGSASLSPGINIGGMFFSAEAANAADALFVPAGLELRIGASKEGLLQPWVRFAGGMAWFRLTPDIGSVVSEFVPYAEAGIGTDLFFGPLFGITAEVDFRFIFEGSVILYHVAPGIGAAFRF